MRGLRRIALLVLLALVCVSAARAQQQRGPSTAEERARAVKIAHALEADPLSSALKSDREWLLKWIIEVPDLTVDLCSEFLKPILESKKNYSPEIFAQTTFSQAAFIIEHPDKARDEAGVYQAGLEGSLKAYSAILKNNPKARWPFLDELIQKRDAGKLEGYVREKMKGCKNSGS